MNNSESVYIEPIFERESFHVEIDPPEFPYKDHTNDFEDIHDRIQKLANQLLFHWSEAPVSFPQSIVGNAEELKNQKNLFIYPTFNELEELSIDQSTRLPKKLNSDQLESIKKTGSFEVPSKHFPGKFHRWQLAKFLQKGYENSNATLYSGLSLALELLIVTARDRLIGNKFSVLAGLKTWKGVVKGLCDILFGLPHKYINYTQIEQTIRDELQEYMVAELKVDDSEKQKSNETCNMILMMLKSKQDRSIKKDLHPPSFYRTAENLLIDLRLFNPRIIELIIPILRRLLQNDSACKNDLVKLRQKLIKKFKADGLNNKEIIEQVEEKLFEAYFERVLKDVLVNGEIEKIAPGIGKTLCDQARSLVLMRAQVQTMRDETYDYVEAYKAELREKYRVRSLVVTWFNRSVNEEKQRFSDANVFTVHERTVEKCKCEGLNQAAYFIQRELNFLRKKKDEICERELNKPKSPKHKFEFPMFIWNPKNYVIEQNFTTEKFELKSKVVKYKNDTMYPFWRWTNFIKRTWCYTWNSIFMLGLLVPFYSGVSFRALFCLNPFHPNKKLNTKTGVMETDYSQKTLTYFSRLKAIWQYVSQRRAEFERQPDKGLLGKSITRVFHVIWSYLFLGGIGTLGLTIVYPPLCLAISTGSLALGLTAPIWYPVLSLVLHLLAPIVFDLDLFGSRISHLTFPFLNILLRAVFCGVASPLVNLLLAVLACPSSSLILTIFTVLRKSFRKCHDTFFYHLILKSRARIPSNNSFVARRTAGPGLASNHFYQIRPEQALAALERYIEEEILHSYFDHVRKRLNEPLDNYENLFTSICSPYSFNFSRNGLSYDKLKNEINNVEQEYRTVYNNRLKEISVSKGKNRIKLTEDNLQIVLREGSEIVKLNYEHVILKYRKSTCKDLFEGYSIDEGDWIAYTGRILEIIFDRGILTPLEKSHDSFELQVNHLNLEKYTQMIAKSKLRDDLDEVMTVYRPESEGVSIAIPERGVENMFSTANESKKSYVNSKWNEDANGLHVPSLLPRNLGLIALIANNGTVDTDLKIEYESLSKVASEIERNFNVIN